MPDRDRIAQANAAPLRPVTLGALDVVVEQRANGELLIRSAQPIGDCHANLSEPLEHWAKAAPERVFLAQRDATRTISGARSLMRKRSTRRNASAQHCCGAGCRRKSRS